MNLRPVRLTCLFTAFACFNVLVTAHAPQPEAAQNKGSISGRVTVDGKPKAGVLIELLTTINFGPRTPIAKATTTKTGRYVITNVESGTYDVSPATPTLVIPNQGRSGQSGKTVTIEPGELVKGINFDLISQGSIRGRIRDVTGIPVKGQTVELILRGENNYLRPFYSSTPGEQTTNDEGIYHISAVPPGRYIVKVGVDYGLAGSGSSQNGEVYYPETFHPDVDEASKATVVEVTAGRETADVDITVGSPLKVFEIVGRIIVAETGAAVPNVGLEIVTTSKKSKNSTHQSGPWRSDVNGEFRIRNAVPGHYTVAPESDAASNTYGEPISFDVTDADVTGLKIPMRYAASLSGIVTLEGNVEYSVADILSKLTISAHSQPDHLMGITSNSNVSSDGGFRIAGVRPGKVSLFSYMRRGGPEGVSLIRIERNGIEVKNGIEVRAGEDLKDFKLVFGAGNSVLRGDVKIECGLLEGVNLYVLYRQTKVEPTRFFRAELDARRHFVAKGLIPGEYELMIGPMSVTVSGEKGGQTMNRMPTVKQTVMVGPGADAEVTLVMTLKPIPGP